MLAQGQVSGHILQAPIQEQGLWCPEEQQGLPRLIKLLPRLVLLVLVELVESLVVLELVELVVLVASEVLVA